MQTKEPILKKTKTSLLLQTTVKDAAKKPEPTMGMLGSQPAAKTVGAKQLLNHGENLHQKRTKLVKVSTQRAVDPVQLVGPAKTSKGN